MTARGIARQYANALFDVARQSEQLESVARELESFGALVAGHDDLRRALGSPAVPPQAKRSLVEQLLNHAGGVPEALRRALLLLAERDRLGLLADVVEAFNQRMTTAGRRIPAEVVTAIPLGEARKAQIGEALGRAVGREVTVTERVDPTILGGVVARVGSLVFDGSVTRQVERLRERLLSET